MKKFLYVLLWIIVVVSLVTSTPIERALITTWLMFLLYGVPLYLDLQRKHLDFLIRVNTENQEYLQSKCGAILFSESICTFNDLSNIDWDSFQIKIENKPKHPEVF